MTPSQPLKNYIRSARKRAGLSQGDLASLLGGRGGKLVSRYELFQREPMLPMALAFESALGVPVNELFKGLAETARQTALRRAKVMELQLRNKPATRATERKRQSLRRIIERSSDEVSTNSSSTTTSS